MNDPSVSRLSGFIADDNTLEWNFEAFQTHQRVFHLILILIVKM